MTDYYQLSDAEWEWVACFLEDRTAPSADALRGYLNDRITERLVTARAEERERTQGIIEELENHIDHLPGHVRAELREQYDAMWRGANEQYRRELKAKVDELPGILH